MTERADLVDLVEALSGARVVCVGDVMLDRFVHGIVERISPEAPIPVLCIERETAMLGGVGNVARNIDALGAQGDVVTTVGDDDAGRQVVDLFQETARITAKTLVDPERPTTIKTRYLAGTQQLMRADRESVAPLPPTIAAHVVEEARRAMVEGAVLVVSDYGKGVLEDSLLADLIAAARDARRLVIVDPKGTDFRRYQGASLITPNRKELSDAARLDTDDDAGIAAAARRVIADCGISGVLATRSRDGMTLVTADDVTHLPTEAQEVYDVSGAGDTVVAALAAALAVGAPLPRAAALANVAAGIVVGKVGTAAAHASEVLAALLHRDISDAESKVLSVGPARDRVDLWRRQGLRVGFTNGCFDLLHPGHVSLLRRAQAACDRLIVGLNTDSSVTRLKGPGRPLQPESARATVLACLESVDLVVIFPQDTPLDLINSLKPDLLVKGADYAIGEVVGADVVQDYGGKVLLLDLEPGHSTSATIARMGP